MQVAQCKAWKELGEASQQLVAERLASLATIFGQWQSAAAQEVLEAYVRYLRQGSEATPRAQRAVLRCLRLAERCQVQGKVLEQLEMLGSRPRWRSDAKPMFFHVSPPCFEAFLS